jgi:hypothetical protein
MLPPPIYLISNKNDSPTLFSIGFVSVGFWTCLNDWTSIIFEEMHCENSCTCIRMYLRKAVLDHLPISMIEKTHTLARYMTIFAPEQMDLVRISDRQTLSFVSPIVTFHHSANRQSSPWLHWWSHSCALREKLEICCLLLCKT